ncbi:MULTISPECIES: hypothetical protein [unclassified Motilimonas]|uniref:hypothetical protein n=1 Tax=Motilimonas TaxID=1914248 RepID=UPI001E65A8A9|nr:MULTISPECIES: hypothetical protein [unclassified Motilimonas]MCE0558362.1 hypothetical protein [Motilimonas sp. E26]MDO6525286.1 hypothetical protein [Motilimonas sp. 1_MG-2023]
MKSPEVRKSTLIMQIIVGVIFAIVVVIGVIAGIAGSSSSDTDTPDIYNSQYETESPF